MYTFSSHDTYKISHSKKDEKLILDYKVLIRLYGPIIGSVSMSLYLTLESEISLNKNSKQSLEIARLHKILQIDEKQFNDAISVLKDYGLLSYKANQRKANDYLFVIHHTKTALEFISDNKLNKALKVIVDDSYYQQVYNYFISSVINEDEYVDIDDLNVNIQISEEQFYERFYEKYPVIANATTISKEAKKEINRLKKLFDLDYNEIENAILNSFDYVNDQMIIDLNKLNDFIESKYKDKLKQESPDEKLAKSFESERSIAYYKKLSGRDALFPRETSMINELLDQYKISEGVLNVVISYYFKYGQKTFGVSKNYFVKVIEEMLINNVKTTVDAMNYFRNRNKRIQSYKENKINRQVEKVEERKEVKSVEEKDSSIDLQTMEEFRKLMGG